MGLIGGVIASLVFWVTAHLLSLETAANDLKLLLLSLLLLSISGLMGGALFGMLFYNLSQVLV